MSKLGKISFLVCGLSIIILFVARLILQGWINYLFIPLAFASLSLIVAFVVDYKFYLEFLSMRTTKHGMNMGVLILLALVIVVALNYLGAKYDKTFDLTQEKMNTLSEQSLDVVKNLKDELKVLIFYKGNQLAERAKEIKNDFKLYKAAGDKINVEIIDANFNVEMAKKYLENAEAFSAILEYKGRRAIIKGEGAPERPVYQEREITSAIVKVTKEKPMTIYFLTGHGEKDIDQSSMDGIKLFADELRKDGYTVAKLNLLVGEPMPAIGDSVIAIVGPRQELSAKEMTQVRDYAKAGGRLFVAADPGEKHHIALLTKSFGIEYKNNFVVNEVAGTDEGLIGAVGFEFDRDSPVTKKLALSRSLSVFAFASELAKAPDATADYAYKDIIRSHPKAYALQSPNMMVKEPNRRSHTLAMTVEKDKFAMVVFGDSDFLTDVRIQRWVHYDLAMNAVAYLFGDDVNITIRPKVFESTQLQITQNKWYMIIAAGVSLPLTLIILSGLFWYRRRNL
jgi:ABC-type uncharacterized transport system involved in gliding motility auxiliary subunit